MKFLFWNTNNNDSINKLIYGLVIDLKIDFIALAEYKDDLDSLCAEINKKTIKSYYVYTSSSRRISIISNSEYVEFGFCCSYFSTLIIDRELIIVIVHLPSKLHAQDEERSSIARTIISEVLKSESNYSSNQTIIFGDFNSNPYEYTCLAADTFHGIPFIEDAKREKRCAYEFNYKMFYNLMWRLWGNEEAPYGTYYYNSNSMICSYWNTFDQVILRPCLIDCFSSENLRVIREIRGVSLLDKNGHPDASMSDHLPLTFELEGK